MNQQRLRPDETELNQQDPEGTRLNRPTKPLPTTPGPHSTHQTHSPILCNVFPSADGQGTSIPASALRHGALPRISLSRTYDALMTPPRDDKQLKSWLYPLDTWHAKPCGKRHVLAWEKAIPTLDSHQAQLVMQGLHLPYCY